MPYILNPLTDPRRVVDFSGCPVFLLVRMEWKFPSSLYTKLKTKSPNNFFKSNCFFEIMRLLEQRERENLCILSLVVPKITSCKTIIQFTLVVHLRQEIGVRKLWRNPRTRTRDIDIEQRPCSKTGCPYFLERH